MSSFTTPLIVKKLNGNWEIVEPFIYEIGKVDSGKLVSVPVGFQTDFASIPRIFWSLLPPTGRYAKAAVTHDYLYRGGKIDVFGIPDNTKYRPTRKEADDIFREGMKVLGVNWLTRQVIYWGVRMGGMGAWRKDV